ncbi:hypothetical protein NIES4074_32190 [Cylindrospermum sp. NIES-4074]|nr:hypothetical protein NIES4074_32190 [Cylindrospermum sp. NIES-4074]
MNKKIEVIRCSGVSEINLKFNCGGCDSICGLRTGYSFPPSVPDTDDVTTGTIWCDRCNTQYDITFSLRYLDSYITIDGLYDVEKVEVTPILSSTKYYNTFINERFDLMELNYFANEGSCYWTLHKLIYIGAITCLERYFKELLINTVLSEDTEDYINSFSSINQEDYSSREEIERKLNQINYLHLDQVSKTYKDILNIDFPDFYRIQKSIKIRNKLVHGSIELYEVYEKDIDDNINSTIEELLNEIKYFVDNIEKEFKTKIKPYEFEVNTDEW